MFYCIDHTIAFCIMLVNKKKLSRRVAQHITQHTSYSKKGSL